MCSGSTVVQLRLFWSEYIFIIKKDLQHFALLLSIPGYIKPSETLTACTFWQKLVSVGISAVYSKTSKYFWTKENQDARPFMSLYWNSIYSPITLFSAKLSSHCSFSDWPGFDALHLSRSHVQRVLFKHSYILFQRVFGRMQHQVLHGLCCWGLDLSSPSRRSLQRHQAWECGSGWTWLC